MSLLLLPDADQELPPDSPFPHQTHSHITAGRQSRKSAIESVETPFSAMENSGAAS